MFGVFFCLVCRGGGILVNVDDVLVLFVEKFVVVLVLKYLLLLKHQVCDDLNVDCSNIH